MKIKFCPMCGAAVVTAERQGRPRQVCPACDYVQWGNPTPVVAALVEHEGDMLLVRSVGWPPGWVGLVAGFLEAGEAPAEGVLREVREELALDATVVSLVGVYPFPQMNQVIIAYHVVATGEVVLGEELESMKRVPPDKLRPWPIGTGQAVADWLAARRGDRGAGTP